MTDYRLTETLQFIDTIRDNFLYAIKKDLDVIENKDELIVKPLSITIKDKNNLGIVTAEDNKFLESFTFVHKGIVTINQSPFWTQFYLTDRGSVLLLDPTSTVYANDFDRYYINCVNRKGHVDYRKKSRVCWSCLRATEKSPISAEMLESIKILTSFKEPLKNITAEQLVTLLDEMLTRSNKKKK